MNGEAKDLSRGRDRLEVEVRGVTSQRLDQYLSAILEWKSRARVQRLIESGRVSVNGLPQSPSRCARAEP